MATPTVHQRGITKPSTTIPTRNKYVMASESSAGNAFALRTAFRGRKGDMPLDGLRISPAVADLPHIDGRIGHLVLGFVLGMATLCLSIVAFFVSLAGCRAENQTHYPAACPAADHHPGSLVFLAVALSLAVFILSLARVSRKVPIGLAGFVVMLYVGYAFAVAVT
jgi:hypothetical protein